MWFVGRGCCLYSMVRESCIDKMTFGQRPEGRVGTSHAKVGERFPDRGMERTKALTQECAGHWRNRKEARVAHM